MPDSSRVTRFNRDIGNRTFGAVLRRLPGFGTVLHRGRRSGREYRTPVKLFRRDGSYIISLPYGQGTDWVRNVLAAEGCDILVRGRRVPVVEPRVFTDRTQSPIPPHLRLVMKRFKAYDFIELRPLTPPSRVPSRRGPG